VKHLAPDVRRRPRVVLVAHEVRTRGGMDKILFELIRLGHDRFDFVVVSSVLAEELRPLVAEWHRVWVPARPFPLRFGWFWVAAGLVVARSARDIVQVTGAIIPNAVDVVGVHFCHRGYREANGSWSDHQAPLARRLNTGATRWVGALAERWCYRRRRAGLLAADSLGLQAELQRYFPGVPSLLVAKGVDSSWFRPRPELRTGRQSTYSSAAGEMVVAFVGGDWHRKGLGVAIEGVAYAARKGADVSLWVAGSHDERPFRALAQELGVAERIRFLGAPQEVDWVYQMADVFVLPSCYETFSLPAHEAAACGIPVVTTRVHGVAELVGDDVAGIIVERDAHSVGEALLRLWADPELRIQMGGQGRSRAEALTWERYGAQMLALYDELLGTSDDLGGSPRRWVAEPAEMNSDSATG
jgi:glycosyltransferase involved in cell wall biosynthesis